MKKVLPALVLLLSIFSISYSQQSREFSLGPFITLKAGLNGGDYMDGRKNALAFSSIPDFGVSMYYPLSYDSDIGMTAEIGVSSYAYDIEAVNYGKTYTMKYNYFTIGSNFYFNMFTAGFNFGYPLGGDYGYEIKTDILEFMAEFRIGAMFPLMSDESGNLNGIIQAGYMLTGIYKNFSENDPLLEFIPPIPPQEPSNKYNHRAISVSIGISYLMNLYPAEE